MEHVMVLVKDAVQHVQEPAQGVVKLHVVLPVLGLALEVVVIRVPTQTVKAIIVDGSFTCVMNHPF